MLCPLSLVFVSTFPVHSSGVGQNIAKHALPTALSSFLPSRSIHPEWVRIQPSTLCPLPCLHFYLPGPFIFIFSKSPPYFLTAFLLAKSSSHVDLQNKTCHPAHPAATFHFRYKDEYYTAATLSFKVKQTSSSFAATSITCTALDAVL